MILHYRYLISLRKIPHWKDLLLVPFGNLENVFLLTLPIFHSYGKNEESESRIKNLVRIFWGIFTTYMVLLFISLILV